MSARRESGSPAARAAADPPNSQVLLRRRSFAWGFRGRKVQTWPYADGKAQNLYVWLKGWTIHVAVTRRGSR